MKINTQEARDSAVYIRDAQSGLEQVKNSVVQVRNKLDQRVVMRSGVNAILNQSIGGLDQIQNRLQAIDSFLTDSATLYEMNETQLQKKARDITNYIELGIIYQLTQGNSQYNQIREETKDSLDFIKGIKKIQEWITSEKYDGFLKKPLDTLSKMDLFTEIWNGVNEYQEGNPETLLNAIRKTGNEVMKNFQNSPKVTVGSTVESILIDYGLSICTTFPTAINQYYKTGEGTAGDVAWSIVGDTLVKAGSSAFEPIYKTATTIAFVGIDLIDQGKLSQAYEDLTGKKGLGGILDLQKQLWVDEVYEKQFKPLAGKAIDNMYKGIADTWNQWTTGCQLIGDKIGKWFK